MVTFDPPKIEHTKPPTIAAIIPDIGGAPEANANPRPNGRATNETTNPEKIFFDWKNVVEISPFFNYAPQNSTFKNPNISESFDIGELLLLIHIH